MLTAAYCLNISLPQYTVNVAQRNMSPCCYTTTARTVRDSNSVKVSHRLVLSIVHRFTVVTSVSYFLFWLRSLYRKPVKVMHNFVCMSVRHILNRADQSKCCVHPSNIIVPNSDFSLCWPSRRVCFSTRLMSAQTLLTGHSIRWYNSLTFIVRLSIIFTNKLQLSVRIHFQ
jgi:hypothetical protein